MKSRIKLVSCLVLSFIVNVLCAEPPNGKSGRSLVVSEPKNDKVISLAGDWEFYWHKLLRPEDFKNKIDLSPHYLLVPGSWHNQGYPLLGYGTYRARISFQEKLKKGLLIY